MDNRHYRRGGMYLLILFSTLVVTVAGMGALAVVQSQLQQVNRDRSYARARAYARTALEMAFLKLQTDDAWRSAVSGELLYNRRTIEEGRYTVLAVDPDDALLTDDDRDRVELTGVGLSGEARYMLSATLKPVLAPNPALDYAVFSAGDARMKGGGTLRLGNAPLATNSAVVDNGFIYGDVFAASVEAGVVVVGTTDTLPEPLTLPQPAILDDYIARATPLPYDTDVTGGALGPGYSDFSAASPEGIYYLEINADKTIDDVRLQGTLIVKTPAGKKIRVKNVHMQPAASNMPVLLVDGNIEYQKPRQITLYESDCSCNYNPLGLPFNGSQDTDLSDAYPGGLFGLVYASGHVKMQDLSRITGALLANTTEFDQETKVIWDAAVAQNPPEGFEVVVGWQVEPQGWRRRVFDPEPTGTVGDAVRPMAP